MADNIQVTAGSGTTIRADDIDGKLYQCIKLALGPDGTLTTLLDAGEKTKAYSVPVVLASDQELVRSTEDITSVASAARTTNSNSDDVDVSKYKEGVFFLNVTAITGATLDVIVKSKDPLSGSYVEIGRFTQVIAAGAQVLIIEKGLGEYLQVAWELSAAPASATFSVGMHFKS